MKKIYWTDFCTNWLASKMFRCIDKLQPLIFFLQIQFEDLIILNIYTVFICVLFVLKLPNVPLNESVLPSLSHYVWSIRMHRFYVFWFNVLLKGASSDFFPLIYLSFYFVIFLNLSPSLSIHLFLSLFLFIYLLSLYFPIVSLGLYRCVVYVCDMRVSV